MLIALVLAIVVALAIGVKAYAKTMKAPEGKLQYYRFSRGGGMNPFDFTIYYLRQDEKTGKPLLTVSGDCDGEVITFNVEQEVFTRCAEIIKEYKLYLSKGHYKERFMVLDAPSSSFHLSFEDSKESVYGSGDWPQRINDGVKAVNGYLMSLVGDRKAEGHVDRIYQGTLRRVLQGM